MRNWESALKSAYDNKSKDEFINQIIKWMNEIEAWGYNQGVADGIRKSVESDPEG